MLIIPVTILKPGSLWFQIQTVRCFKRICDIKLLHYNCKNTLKNKLCESKHLNIL